MTTARYSIPKHRLAQQLKTPGGLPVAEAVANAEANLAELKPQCLSELRRLLAAAEQVFESLDAAYEEAAADALYDAAVRGVGLGELGGVGGVDIALHSLCDLLDHLKTDRRFDKQAVGVHLRAWRLLLTTELPPGGAQAVLAGLNKVSALYGAPRSEDA
jgi:hypothetical protein